jgi:hypothetical protein
VVGHLDAGRQAVIVNAMAPARQAVIVHAMTRARDAVVASGVTRAIALGLAALVSLAHVGSPDTFFTGRAGPYDVRVTVRLPGVIPGRAQVTVRVAEPPPSGTLRISVRAGQWNVGLEGAPPSDHALPVPGDPALYAAEIWFMTPSSYQMAVDVSGPDGSGTAIVPVMALATVTRTLPPGLGVVLAALGGLLTAGLLTMVGSAVRESVLPPGVEPDAARRRRARWAMAITAAIAVLLLWGGSAWWSAEAESYATFVRYRPFDAAAAVAARGGAPTLTLSIRDDRWAGTTEIGIAGRLTATRYNALLPDHGKLMHLFMVGEQGLDTFAHLHPVARTSDAVDFDATLPPLPAGRYRVYGDIVHESGYAQTLVAAVDVGGAAASAPPSPTDPDDSWLIGGPASTSARTARLSDGATIVWDADASPVMAGADQTLTFSVHDAAGAVLEVEPYMGMAAHVIVASHDHEVFAHLHPAGSVSMAALQKFTGAGADPHAGHTATIDSRVAVPYAFPRAGRYRVWVQVKRAGRVETGAFDIDVR